MDGGLIILLLFAVVAAWVFSRIARLLRLPINPKTYMVIGTIVIIGTLMLYANSYN